MSLGNLLYASGGQGSLRYVFLHGSHEKAPASVNDVTVEAHIQALTQEGHIASDQPRTRYQFVNGVCADPTMPVRHLVGTLLKNVSIPTVIIAEVPIDQSNITHVKDPYVYLALLVTGRTDLGQCDATDRQYVEKMLHDFVPSFVQSLAMKSNEYLPGDAQNLSRDVAERMKALDNPQVDEFLQLYRQRYIGRKDLNILETCLLHILKMPFEVTSAARQGLIRY
ncbi:hypothetical protein BDV26DRAFT_297357 [Aspergillus bertholletiae]|uniref:Uncharacterized protein n=1 Tax=Aspergillus bertholletiae TaxID=1226010 RepID=A0A5N7AVF2_9EURO|nr:hypothetical protein BDV26DRAFT_297357 [Aspergillus bertholletiae]